MDYEKFCGLDSYGVYSFVFPNKYALEIEEIKAYFSKFEGYLDVKAAFGHTGMRFIRFSTFEYARVAMDSLQDHPTMCLVPYERHRKGTYNPGAYDNLTRCAPKEISLSEIDNQRERVSLDDPDDSFAVNTARHRFSFGAMRLQKFREDLFKCIVNQSSGETSIQRGGKNLNAPLKKAKIKLYQKMVKRKIAILLR